jgi:putative ABC transport system substrate-binding protein
MNYRRKLLAAFGAGSLLAPLAALAQKTKVHRLGLLSYTSRQAYVETGRQSALMKGLAELGYVEGKTFVLEERFADGKAERLDALAAELVRMKVDLILSSGTPAHVAAQRATRAIPIVVMSEADPVGNGLAASLARPGANLTGMSTFAAELIPKLVELLVAAVPRSSRIAVLVNPGNRGHLAGVPRVQAAVQQGGRRAFEVSARTAGEIELAFATMKRERAEAVILLIDGFFFQQRRQIAELALKHRLASIYPAFGYAEVGGLMNYGADLNENLRRAGIFVDKILKGANPAELPFEQPTRYYLVINRKTASGLGIEMPQELLMRADNVIQ